MKWGKIIIILMVELCEARYKSRNYFVLFWYLMVGGLLGWILRRRLGGLLKVFLGWLEMDVWFYRGRGREGLDEGFSLIGNEV